MMGDAVDNIPGITGVGEDGHKTAQAVWQSRVFIGKHRSSKKGKLREKK